MIWSFFFFNFLEVLLLLEGIYFLLKLLRHGTMEIIICSSGLVCDNSWDSLRAWLEAPFVLAFHCLAFTCPFWIKVSLSILTVITYTYWRVICSSSFPINASCQWSRLYFWSDHDSNVHWHYHTDTCSRHLRTRSYCDQHRAHDQGNSEVDALLDVVRCTSLTALYKGHWWEQHCGCPVWCRSRRSCCVSQGSGAKWHFIYSYSSQILRYLRRLGDVQSSTQFINIIKAGMSTVLLRRECLPRPRLGCLFVSDSRENETQ